MGETMPIDHLKARCRSTPELEKLLRRIEQLVPIVRRQRREANRAAETAYFESDNATPEARAMWRDFHCMSGYDLCQIEYRDPDTREWRELHSIGLAVAAFGGDDAISLIGWVVGGTVWSEWDGMANHWL